VAGKSVRQILNTLIQFATTHPLITVAVIAVIALIVMRAAIKTEILRPATSLPFSEPHFFDPSYSSRGFPMSGVSPVKPEGRSAQLLYSWDVCGGAGAP
jgi:hypothetical protein